MSIGFCGRARRRCVAGLPVLSAGAVLETLPAAFPLDPTLQAHAKHDRPGIAYRHALADSS